MRDNQSQDARQGLIAVNADIVAKAGSISNEGFRAVNAVITTGNGLRAGGGKVFLNSRNEINRRQAANGVIAANADVRAGGSNIRN